MSFAAVETIEAVQETANEILVPFIPVKHQGDTNYPVLEYELPIAAKCISWGGYADDILLVIGHDMGVIMLTRSFEGDASTFQTKNSPSTKWTLKSTYRHLGVSVDKVRFRNNVLVAAHPGYSLSVISQDVSGEFKLVRYDGSHCHDSFINSIDIASDGTIASTSDDRTVIVYDKNASKGPQSYHLAQRGLEVRFWEDATNNRLLVLESGNKVRILDYNKGHWLVTIYPGINCGLTRDLGVFRNNILITGSGWWKAYDPQHLSGGCGHTKPSLQGTLVGDSLHDKDEESRDKAQISPSLNNRLNHTVVSVNDARFVANLSTRAFDVYDLEQGSEYGSHISHNLPGQISGCSLSENGAYLAVISRKTLVLYKASM